MRCVGKLASGFPVYFNKTFAYLLIWFIYDQEIFIRKYVYPSKIKLFLRSLQCVSPRAVGVAMRVCLFTVSAAALSFSLRTVSNNNNKKLETALTRAILNRVTILCAFM